MKHTPIIRRKNITVAALLRKVKELVLEEPLRLNMRDWVSLFKGEGYWTRSEPACGTVGCIAGWCAILLREPTDTSYGLQVYANSRAHDALGLTSDYVVEDTDIVTNLFSSGPHPEFGEKSDNSRILGGRPGTKAHAKAVAKRIDTFLAQHPELETRLVKR